jgi:hypothetical protein
VSLISIAATEQNETQPRSNSKATDYRAGQVWEGIAGATVTILLVEDMEKAGKIIHVRVDNIPIRSCGGFHLSTSIDHIALTEKMLRKNPLDLLEENAQIPDSYLEGYREWEKQKKHVLLKQPIQDEIPLGNSDHLQSTS